jgi:hypothetical protein
MAQDKDLRLKPCPRGSSVFPYPKLLNHRWFHHGLFQRWTLHAPAAFLWPRRL